MKSTLLQVVEDKPWQDCPGVTEEVFLANQDICESEEGTGVPEMMYILIWRIVSQVCAHVKSHCPVLSRCILM